jgi:hypothetical protein
MLSNTTLLLFFLRMYGTLRLLETIFRLNIEEGVYIDIYIYIKGKTVPLQAWNGPEGSRKLRFPDFLTTAQYGGKVASPTHRPPLHPGNTPGTHFC